MRNFIMPNNDNPLPIIIAPQALDFIYMFSYAG